MSNHKKGKVLRSDAREMVYNVIQYFEEEKRAKRYHPYKNSNLRAALATGLSMSTISKIRKEGKLAEQSQTKLRTPSKGNRGRNNTRVSINIANLCNIREIISFFYDAEEVPTTEKIKSKAKQDFDLDITRPTLRRILKNKIGFRFKKLSRNRRHLFEIDSIKIQRALYLKQIRSNDALKENKRPVIYVDESFVDVTAYKIKGKKTDVQRYFIIQAVSEKGYLKDSVSIIKAENNCQEINSKQFIKYVQENLLPNLPDKCILVVDNASFHNVELNKAPSSMASKDDIKKWMVDNYMPFEEEWTKAELIVQLKNNMPEKEYVFDSLVRTHGHEVLRLPPYNFDLNPIERLWDKVKERFTELFTNVDDDQLENLSKDVIDLTAVDEWRSEIDSVKTTERKYWLREVVRERKFEDFMSKLGINNDDNSDDSSGGASSSDESEGNE